MPGRLAALLRPQPTPLLLPLGRRGRSLAVPAALALALFTGTGRAATAPAGTSTSQGPTASPRTTATPAKPPRPAAATPAKSQPGAPPTPTPTPGSSAVAPSDSASATSPGPAFTTGSSAPPATPGPASAAPPPPSSGTTPVTDADISSSTAPEPAAPEDAPTSPTGPRADVPRLAPAPPGEIPPEPPRDPNDAAFMQPPNNQPRPTRLRTSPDIRRGYSSVRRFAVTIAPVFASFRLPFQGRTNGDTAPRQHGVGVGGELDVQIIRWLWVRAQASYSAHPVGDVRVTDDKMNVDVVAPAGTIQALGFGVGPVVALDLGRFIPLIEGGIGGLRVATPTGLKPGQMGQACDDDVCDVGLRCAPDNTCQQSVIPDLYFGGAVDMLVRRHISLGVQFRYHALLSAPGKFPVYLIGGLRLGVRF